MSNTKPNYNCSSISCKLTLLLFPFLFLLQFIVSYPGPMTADSIAQYRTSIDFNFGSHHPPITSMVWFVLNQIYSGPQVMLGLQLILLWCAIAFLYYADKTNKYRWLYFVLPFIPSVSGEICIIWKDVQSSVSLFFVFAICFYYFYRDRSAPIFLTILTLLIFFYGIGAKFQVKFIAPIVVFFLLKALLKKGQTFNVIGTIIVSVILITGDDIIINRFATNSYWNQLRQFFDIAAITNDLNEDSKMPVYIKEYQGYEFVALKNKFTHKWVDNLVFREDKVYNHTLNTKHLDQLNDAFIELATSHPLLYAKHRLINHYIMQKTVLNTGFLKDVPNLKKHVKNELGVDIHVLENNPFQDAFIWYLRIFPRFLSSNLISLAILILCIAIVLKCKNLTLEERNILNFLVLSCISFNVVLLFTTMASDHRYYFFVRLWTLFIIPLLLKIRSRHKQSSIKQHE